MSRIPRSQEHLKTAFTAEAVSAARFRAYAAQAAADGLPNLAERWRKLAAGKDALAVQLLVAAEQVQGLGTDVANAVSEERYENDILYPKMARDVDPDTGAELGKVMAAQKDHLKQLEALRDQLTAARGDVAA